MTLSIRDPVHRELFMNFAVEEIQDVVPYYVVMSGCFFAAQLIIIFKEGKLPYILIWLILEFL